MVLKSDKEKVKTLLSETIRLLCKNGLHFRAEFSVEALVGITLDQEEEFFLSIKETVKTDLVSSTKDTVHHEHKPKRVREHIKGEPGTSSRKRGAETVTSEGEDLGGLSLGDIQEGEQSFWSTVTDSGGSGGGHPGGTPFKKRHIEPNREDSSSSAPQIVVKGEPESDSDIEEVASTSGADPASTQMAHMGDSFAFGSQAGAPVGYTGLPQQSAIPPQVWDQLPPFSSLPGTSGVQSATNTVTSPDGHQQGDTTRPNNPSSSLVDLDLQTSPAQAKSSGLTPRELKQQRIEHMQKDPFFIPRLMRRILLTKGREVTPKQVYWNFSYKDRPSCALIHQVMKELDSKGLGVYGRNERKTTFAKKEPWTVGTLLVSYGINLQKYEEQYYARDGMLLKNLSFPTQ